MKGRLHDYRGPAAVIEIVPEIILPVRDRQLVLLLLALLLLLVAYPYVEGSLAADLTLNLLQALIALAAVSVVSTDRKHFVIAAVLGATSLVSGWIPRAQEMPAIFVIGAAGGIGYELMAIVMIVEYVLRVERVNYNLLCGALCSYLLIGFFWTDVYDLLEYLQPHSLLSLRSPQVRLGWTDFLYFSFTSLTEIGNSEIVPASSSARSAMMLECIVGIFYMAIVVSRLVGLHIAGQNGAAAREPE